MQIEINSKEALITATCESKFPVAFVVGAPISKDSGGGVALVDEIVALAREKIRSKAAYFIKTFEDNIKSKTGAEAYQDAMKWVRAHLTQDSVNAIIHKAVMDSRKPNAPADFEGDGIVEDWYVAAGIRELADLIKIGSEQFRGPIFTTNFDPLLSLQLESVGCRTNLRVADSDGRVGRKVETRQGIIDIVHLHGYWRGSDTLHTPSQLLSPRPLLKTSLQNAIHERTLVVVAYGGWDDVLVSALADLSNNDDAQFNILWCFYETDEAKIESANQKLFEKFARAIQRGRFLPYKGIDCHKIFGEIARQYAKSLFNQPLKNISFPGWLTIDRSYLDELPALSEDEVIRYFDGAVPAWRHAVCASIPKREYHNLVSGRLEETLKENSFNSLQLIRAAGGEGKTTLLLQVAATTALNSNWSVIWRTTPETGLPTNQFVKLDPGQKWLIVVDDADNMIEDLAECARTLHQMGRTNVCFLLATRDTDWIHGKGNDHPWSQWLKYMPDIVLRGLSYNDADIIVNAWNKYGKPGLRELNSINDSFRRIARLQQAIRNSADTKQQGSFFGGLLAVRFSPEGLRSHVRVVLTRLKAIPIKGSNNGSTLFDAFLYVSAVQAPGILGININVLSTLLGVSRDWQYSKILRPLGEEAAMALQNSDFVLTRHKKIAEAVLIEAESLGTDLSEIWAAIVRQTVLLGREMQMEYFKLIAHASIHLQNDLPRQLSETTRKSIAIAAASARVKAETNLLVPVITLAKTFRIAEQYKNATLLLRSNILKAPQKTDYQNCIRGFWSEWGVCEKMVGPDITQMMIGTFLQGGALSDHLNPVSLTDKDIKLGCSGLGLAFGDLMKKTGDLVFGKAHRSMIFIGRPFAKGDGKAIQYLINNKQECDSMNVPEVTDSSEAISWLKDAMQALKNKLDDELLNSLVDSSEISFEHLHTRLKSHLD